MVPLQPCLSEGHRLYDLFVAGPVPASCILRHPIRRFHHWAPRQSVYVILVGLWAAHALCRGCHLSHTPCACVECPPPTQAPTTSGRQDGQCRQIPCPPQSAGRTRAGRPSSPCPHSSCRSGVTSPGAVQRPAAAPTDTRLLHVTHTGCGPPRSPKTARVLKPLRSAVTS